MLPDLAKFFLFALFHFVEGALLEMNRWYEIPMRTGQTASLDFDLFLTCERFSLVFTSDMDEINRLTFLFDGEDLRKVDVDSPDLIDVPSPPPVIGGCRETDVKSLRLNVSIREHTFDIQIGRQVAIRPKNNSSETLRLLLPQRSACCLVQGNLSIEDDILLPVLRRKEQPAMKVAPTTKLPSSSSSHGSLFTGILIPPVPKPTPRQDVQRLSWTHVVNREWSITFLICSFSVLFVMVSMISLGVIIFLYLQIKPPPKKRPCFVEA